MKHSLPTLLILLLLTLSSCTSNYTETSLDCAKQFEEKMIKFQETAKVPLVYEIDEATISITDELYVAIGKDTVVVNNVIYVRE